MYEKFSPVGIKLKLYIVNDMIYVRYDAFDKMTDYDMLCE